MIMSDTTDQVNTFRLIEIGVPITYSIVSDFPGDWLNSLLTLDAFISRIFARADVDNIPKHSWRSEGLHEAVQIHKVEISSRSRNCTPEITKAQVYTHSERGLWPAPPARIFTVVNTIEGIHIFLEL